ncbi:MAG TPA: hypothetical protein ENK15_02780 [Thermopetrobacter sp.]|nr:hypothetical protein [Thermopetrobacter sp.]
MPPDEQPDDAWPFVLTAGRVLEHWHTGAMTSRATVLDALQPAPIVAMNARDMAALAVEDGGMRTAEKKKNAETAMHDEWRMNAPFNLHTGGGR